MAVCIFIVWFSYTGTIWNLNRGPPFILGGGGQGFSIIYPQLRMQTVLEGIVVPTLLLIIGGVFVVFGVYIPNIKKEKELKHYFYLAAAAFGFSYLMLHVIWLRKTPGYLMFQ